jgi:hypothetical protein
MADYKFGGESRFGNLFGSGSKAVAVIVVVVLVALVVGFAGHAVYKKLTTPKASNKIVAGGVRFRCMACGKEFGVPVKEILKLSRSNHGRLVLDCRLCEAKGAAVRMRRCPSPTCKKYFVLQTAQEVYDAKKDGTEPDIKGIREICTHCKIDIFDFLEKRMRRGMDGGEGGRPLQ